MKRNILIIIATVFTIVSVGNAQEEADIDMIVRDLLEDMAIDGRLSENGDEAQDLYELAEKKIDINSATADELRSIHVLTESQVQSIIYERSRVGAFNSVLDLMMMPEFDEWFVTRLARFIKYDDPAEKHQRHYLKGEFLSRVAIQTPKAAGFDTIVKSPYVGEPLKLLSRNKLSLDDKLTVGFVAESDMGEPICSHGVSLTDFTSGFLSYKNNHNGIARAVIGHYHIHIGQGLGVWTGFSTDQTSVQASIDRRTEIINPTLSAAESGYLRGGACMLVHNKSYLTLYSSWTDNDATMLTMSNDTIEESEYVQTIQKDGYHRTQKEIEGRNNVETKLSGVYASQGFYLGKIGVGANKWRCSVPLSNGDQLYRLNYPSVEDIVTYHTDFRLIYPRVKIYGEGALQDTRKKGLAVICGIDLALAGGSYLTIAYRDFSRNYYAAVQNPYSRWAQPSGERGMYMAMQTSPVRKLEVLTSINLYSNRWLTYRCMFPSDGYKIRLNAKYAINKNAEVAIRVRIDDNDISSSANQYKKEREHRISYKMHYESAPLPIVRFKGAVEQIHYRKGEREASIGWWFSQELKIKAENMSNLSATLYVAHFDTDDYNSRIYAYMPDMLYSMSTPAYSGKGVIAIGQLGINPVSNLTLTARVKRLRYLDREEIGTGNEKTSGAGRTEFKIQLRYKLFHRL